MTLRYDSELEEYQEWERKQSAFAFQRTSVRKRRLKFLATCGHWVDGSEPYRYSVWRVNGMPRGEISQRTDCEFCARADNAY